MVHPIEPALFSSSGAEGLPYRSEELREKKTTEKYG
jgi:hypothetical protein